MVPTFSQNDKASKTCYFLINFITGVNFLIVLGIFFLIPVTVGFLTLGFLISIKGFNSFPSPVNKFPFCKLNYFISLILAVLLTNGEFTGTYMKLF